MLRTNTPSKAGLPPPPTFQTGTMDQQQSHDSSGSSSISDAAGDGSKSRRNFHLQVGPLTISGAAIDRVRARIGNFTSKLTMDTLRPLPLFLGITGPSLCPAADAFSPPISISTLQANKSTHEKLSHRFSRNLAYFATNYAFLVFGTIIVVAMMHPAMLAYVAITYILWYLHIVMIREDVRLVVMDKDLNDILTPKRRSYILAAWTVWVAVWKCLKPLLLGVGIGGFMVLFHALMRDPKKLAGDIVANRSGVGRGSADSDEESERSEVLVERPDPEV